MAVVCTLNGSCFFQVIYQRDPSVVMYSYLVAKDEYKRLKHQRRTEGQNLYFPQQGENTQPTEQTQSDTQASRLPGGEGESISFLAGQRQAPYPNTGGQRQAPYPNTGARGGEGDSISFVAGKRQASYPSTGGQGFSYPQQSSGQRQGYGGGEQSQRGKQVNTCSCHWSNLTVYKHKSPKIIFECSSISSFKHNLYSHYVSKLESTFNTGHC